MSKNSNGHILLLTGISGAGKTTLGKQIRKTWRRSSDSPIELIDGDEARNFLQSNLGYTDEDRFLVTKIMAYAAKLLSKNGINVIFCNIAAKKKVRFFLHECWDDYTYVFLDADISDCVKNDPRGVYKENMAKKKSSIVGIDIPYEKPEEADLVVYTHKESISDSHDRIISLLKFRNILK